VCEQIRAVEQERLPKLDGLDATSAWVEKKFIALPE